MKIIVLEDKMISQKEFQLFQEILERIETITISLKEIEEEISYRQLVYWYNEGLLVSDPTNGKLKNIGFIDYCWMQVVKLMRTYGMSISSIKAIKAILFDTVDWLLILEQSNSMDKFLQLIPELDRPDFINYIKELRNSPDNINPAITFFFISLMDCLIFRKPLSFLVNTNNDIVVFKELHLNSYGKEKGFNEFYSGSYLKISLSEIVWSFLKIDGSDLKDKQLDILTEVEATILKAVRAGDVKEITVRFDTNDEPDILEVKKIGKVETSARLIELIKANSYQKITLITQAGNPVYYENTIKLKLQQKGIAN